MQHVASFLVPADRLDKTDGPKFFAWGQRRKVPSSDRLIVGSLGSCLGVHLSACRGLLLSPIISRPVKWEFCTWGLEGNNKHKNEIFLRVCKGRETTPNMLLLLQWRYNSGRVLAFSKISFYLSQYCTCTAHFKSFIFFRSFLTSSSHRDLGLPAGLPVNGFHLCILFTVLLSDILFMCPNQLSRWALT